MFTSSPKKSSKVRANVSEREAAEIYGGRQQINSGALRHSKGDVKADDYLIDDKFTDAASYALKLETMRKIEHEAHQHRRKPLLRVTIQGKTYCVIPEPEFLNLRARANKK